MPLTETGTVFLWNIPPQSYYIVAWAPVGPDPIGWCVRQDPKQQRPQWAQRSGWALGGAPQPLTHIRQLALLPQNSPSAQLLHSHGPAHSVHPAPAVPRTLPTPSSNGGAWEGRSLEDPSPAGGFGGTEAGLAPTIVSPYFFSILFLKKLIYLFLYFWSCRVFVASPGFSSCSEQELLALVASLVAEYGL